MGPTWSTRYNIHLLRFNDVKVQSLGHLKELVSQSTDLFMTFKFAPKDRGGLVLLD